MMSLRQLEYIQYYVKAMKLIQPTTEAVERYRKALEEVSKAAEEEQGEGSQVGSEDGQSGGKADLEEWEIDVEKLADLPLPSSKFWLLRKDLTDIVRHLLSYRYPAHQPSYPQVPIQLLSDDDIKRAMSNPRTWYLRAKGQTTEQDTGSGTGTVASTRPVTPAVVKEDGKDAVEESVGKLEGLKLADGAGDEEKGNDDLAWTPIEESSEGSKGESRDAVSLSVSPNAFSRC